MSKYEEDYKVLKDMNVNTLAVDFDRAVKTFKELVELATPEKPKNIKYSNKYACYIGFCPNCKDIVFETDNYCVDCGKKLLDWSDSNA